MLDWIKKNIGFVLSVAFVVGASGCGLLFPVTTESVANPGTKVTRSKLDGEVAAAEAHFKAAYASLDEQEAARLRVFESLSSLAGTVPGPWTPFLTPALGALAIGLGYDNRRKDAVIQGQKTILSRVPPANDGGTEGR